MKYKQSKKQNQRITRIYDKSRRSRHCQRNSRGPRHRLPRDRTRKRLCILQYASWLGATGSVDEGASAGACQERRPLRHRTHRTLLVHAGSRQRIWDSRQSLWSLSIRIMCTRARNWKTTHQRKTTIKMLKSLPIWSEMGNTANRNYQRGSTQICGFS